VQLLFAVVLLDLIGFGIVIPILPFLSPRLGADNLDIAYIIVTYALCSGLFAPYWGRLSDRIGRKPVIMICLAGAAVSYVMLGLASELWMVYVARGFAGLMAGNFGVASAMMADITKPQNRAKGMGLIGAAFGMGLVLGPLLGGLLSSGGSSFVLPCIVAGVMSVLAIIAAALFLPESLSAEKREANRVHQKSGTQGSILAMLKATGNRLLVFQYVMHNAAVSSITYLFPLWVGDLLNWSAKEVGIVFGVQGALIAILQGGVMGPAVRELGEVRFLRVGVSTCLLGVALAVFAASMPFMLAAALISLSGATLCMPLLNTLITHRTPHELRGRMMGTTGAASSWGRVLGPLLAGANLALFGYTGAWIGCVVIVFLYFIWAWSPQERSSERIS
jgi:DHA1 family tetracycline resistance protein-like MFS transporter